MLHARPSPPAADLEVTNGSTLLCWLRYGQAKEQTLFAGSRQLPARGPAEALRVWASRRFADAVDVEGMAAIWPCCP